MFRNDQLSFPSREEQILRFWAEKGIFKKSITQRDGAPLYSFYDGPPFATGLPHYGHLLAGTIKDVVPRYMTMKGFQVPRRFGWDCHGLPVENEIEKAKQLSGASAIEDFGIASFNEECRSIVLRYTSEWKKTVDRMGRWVDFEDTYRTMDPSFMESVWWVFSQLWKKGLVYQGYKVMPFSWKLGTPLSNFEANLNYKEVDDPSLTVLFPVDGEENTYLLIWTTTPWTLPSNLAACVHPDLTYVKIIDPSSKKSLYLAEGRVSHYFPEGAEIVETLKGSALVGKSYRPLFPYFAEMKKGRAFRVVSDPFVGAEDGTGIVHMAPAFGESDFFICLREGIEAVCPVDQNGRFTKAVSDYEGILVKDADREIIKRLKSEGLVFAHSQIRHRYPFCWRSDTPLIYRAVDTWFVSVESIKEDLLASNEQIYWFPHHIKHGRFGKWLENARDWAISRNRYWGTPIPIWKAEDGECIVIESKEELERLSKKTVEDLHRHFIDEITFEKNGKIFRRVPEVFDCWFESGSMPYAQNHYPFENKELTERGFPADFIAEGLDQTRGWFYTLTILSTALFKKPAFKNVIVNGIILAEDGQKMSKRLKNYPEPEIVINKFGSDAVRLFLLSSPAVAADDLRFSERGVEQILRTLLIPLWNAYVFLSTYANIYGWTPEKRSEKGSEAIDLWIRSRLQSLIAAVDKGMESYDLQSCITPFTVMVDELTNWYIRRNRARFWSDQESENRNAAFSTLYDVLLTLSKVAAPFIPFIAEAIYQELRTSQDKESVHLCDFPLIDHSVINKTLEEEMSLAQTIVSLGHSLRKEQRCKVRQPLAKAYIVSSDHQTLDKVKGQLEVIADELNVKGIEFVQNEAEFVTLVAKPNFRVLGKKVGQLMNSVKTAIEALERSSLEKILKGEPISLTIGLQTIEISPGDVDVIRLVKEGVVALSHQNVTVALDMQLTKPLLLEGIAREIVNKVNTMRRENEFAVVDRITIRLEAPQQVLEAFELHRDYIASETLATMISIQKLDGDEIDINGYSCKIEIEKN